MAKASRCDMHLNGNLKIVLMEILSCFYHADKDYEHGGWSFRIDRFADMHKNMTAFYADSVLGFLRRKKYVDFDEECRSQWIVRNCSITDKGISEYKKMCEHLAKQVMAFV